MIKKQVIPDHGAEKERFSHMDALAEGFGRFDSDYTITDAVLLEKRDQVIGPIIGVCFPVLTSDEFYGQ